KREKPFNQLCTEFGISEKTGHKWKSRFLEQGKQGLIDQSRAPKSNPTLLPQKVVIDIVQLKLAHMAWGPKKILAIYKKAHANAPSLPSVKRIFADARLVKHRKVRRVDVSSTQRLRQRIHANAPNDVWAIDFKGWWKSNQEICEPLTIRDLYSRFILEIRLMESKSADAVRAVLTEVFRKYGLPRVIRSDNGTPFASPNGLLALSTLSSWWITLGILPDRIEKGKPGQNGSLERMHTDIAKEIQGKFPGGRRQNQAALDMWREEYNTLRPNEAIGMRTPREVYVRSERTYPGDFDELEYPPGFLVRKVSPKGYIKLYGVRIHVGLPVRGLTLGLQSLGESGKYHVFLADFLLGQADTEVYSFSPLLKSAESL
ncbi:MAG: integrase core domain-containing protein, partial [Spirochaetota bacterium]|nr:integrase core domain-containing protein [Spirochaetota bacterium]